MLQKGGNERSFIFAIQSKIKLKNIFHKKVRVPPGCILNGGTVPPGCILNEGTVPPGCILNGGTVPPGCILNRGTVNPGCILNGGTVPPFHLFLYFFWCLTLKTESCFVYSRLFC